MQIEVNLVKFTKMHGLGNDYLYVYGEVSENISEVSQKLSDRYFGAGAVPASLPPFIPLSLWTVSIIRYGRTDVF